MKHLPRLSLRTKIRNAFCGFLGEHPGWTGACPEDEPVPWLALGVAVVLGLILRLHHLAGQSVWIDEYYAMVPLSAHTWHDSLSIINFYMPDQVPFWHVIHYAFSCLTGVTSAFSFRLLHVFCGLSCIPLMYVLGRQVYGSRPGLLAAFLVAVSPFHIWIAQDLRPNVFFEPLAIVSMLMLMRAVQSGGVACWVLNVLANLVLMWLHVFMVFLVVAEGCFLLFHVRSRLRQAALWAAVTLGVVLSPLLWMHANIRNVQNAEEDAWRKVPPVSFVLCDILSDDAIMTVDPLAFSGQTWGFLPTHLQLKVISLHGKFDGALELAFGAAAFWALLWMLRLWRQKSGGRDWAKQQIFLLLVAFLPVVLLFLGSVAFRPMLMPRYTTYSSFALYAFAGAAITHVRWNWVRRLLLGLFVALYCYQLSLALPAKTRTDWHSVIKHIRAQARPGDVVLCNGDAQTRNVYRYNAGQMPLQDPQYDPPAVPACSLQSVIEKTDRVLPASSSPNAVWVVLEMINPLMPPLPDFEACLASRGLNYVHRYFPGMSGVQVYRVRRNPEAPAGLSAPCRLEGNVADYAGILADMGFSGGPEYDAALKGIRRVVDADCPRAKLSYALVALSLCDEREPRLAWRAAQRSIEMDPNYALGHFAAAVAAYENSEPELGDAAFGRAKACDTTGFIARYGPLLQNLYHSTEPSSAKPLIAELESTGVYLPFIFHIRAGLAPDSLSLPFPSVRASEPDRPNS